MNFWRFGPNGARALFYDERDVPPGWVGTEDDARRMQALAPPPFADVLEMDFSVDAAIIAKTESFNESGGRVRKSRRK